MHSRTAKNASGAKKKAKAARLTQNDKKVLKRANLLRGPTRTRIKDKKDESTNKPARE